MTNFGESNHQNHLFFFFVGETLATPWPPAVFVSRGIVHIFFDRQYTIPFIFLSLIVRSNQLNAFMSFVGCGHYLMLTFVVP